MAKPIWQYLTISEPPRFRLSPTEQLHAFVIMIIAFIIITIQLVYIVSKLRQESPKTDSIVPAYYIIMLFGVYLLTISSTAIRTSIYLTNGEFTMFAQEKALPFFLGTIFFVFGLTNVSFSIIDFRVRTQKIIKWVYILFVVIAGTVVVVQVLVIGGMEQFTDLVIRMEGISAVLAILLMFVFIIALIVEMRAHPSKIEQLRLGLLSTGVLLIILVFLITGSTSVLKDINNAEGFIMVTTYVVPLGYLVLQPLLHLVMYWSLITPNWLLIKTGVIQPSFRRFLTKQKDGKSEVKQI